MTSTMLMLAGVALAPGPGGRGPTYAGDVAAILDRRCAGCHRAGEVGPFPLTAYRHAARRGPVLAEAIESGRMPPWHADPRHGRFANDPRLTDRERELVLTWVADGCPEGDPADLPPPIPRANGWQAGPPDRVVTMPEPFRVPAAGVVDYQYFEVDPGFVVDQWVRSVEIRPGNRRVVHHCTVFLKPPGPGAGLAAQGKLGSFCLATATPGTPPLVVPAGMAKRIPAGWRLVFVVHYAPIGTPQEDRTSVGLTFADPATVRREVATNVLIDPDLVIPPGRADHRVERSRRFDEDVLLLAFFPHMHARGRSFRYEATFPDGRREILLDVPRFDADWQGRYELAEPRRLPAGTTLRCVARYDNSAANPANPDPSATVVAGPQGTDEMFNGYYEFARALEDRTRPATPGLVAPAIAAGSATALLALRRRRRRSPGA